MDAALARRTVRVYKIRAPGPLRRGDPPDRVELALHRCRVLETERRSGRVAARFERRDGRRDGTGVAGEDGAKLALEIVGQGSAARPDELA